MAKSKSIARRSPNRPPAAVGDIVKFHDPRDQAVYPAVVTHADRDGKVDLYVFRASDHNIPYGAGDFGHYTWPEERASVSEPA